MSGFAIKGVALSDEHNVAIQGRAALGLVKNNVKIYERLGALSFITSVTVGATRTDYNGRTGMRITVGNIPLIVQALGRWVFAQNTGQVVLSLYTSGGGLWRSGTLVYSTATPNRFAYVAVPPYTLLAGQSYFIVGDAGGANQWGDAASWSLTSRADASFLLGWFRASDSQWFTGDPGIAYGPVNFLYTK